MMKILLCGTAAAACVAFVPAMAQPAPPPPPGVAQGTTAPLPPIAPLPPLVAPPMIAMHGMAMKIETRDEAVAHAREMFAKLDSNKDGFITREEAEAGHKAMAGKMHGAFDKQFVHGDFPHPDRGAMFDKLDANHDGSISRQEYMAAKPEIRERRVIVMNDGKGPVEVGADGPPDGSPDVMIMHGDGAAPGMGSAPRVKVLRVEGMRGMHGKMFDMADANHDGRVSMDEMTSAALKHFDQADANHDGKLSPDERMQMHREVIEKVIKMKPA